MKEIDFYSPPEIFGRLNPNWQERKCREIIWWQGAEIVPGKKSWAGERMEDAALDGESCNNSLTGGHTYTTNQPLGNSVLTIPLCLCVK